MIIDANDTTFYLQNKEDQQEKAPFKENSPTIFNNRKHLKGRVKIPNTNNISFFLYKIHYDF